MCGSDSDYLLPSSVGNRASTPVSVDSISTLAGSAESGTARLTGTVAVQASEARCTDAHVATLVTGFLLGPNIFG